MIFRNGHISGFIDSLIDSLQISEQHEAIVNYCNLLDLSIGNSPNLTDTNIFIPLCFVYLSTPNSNVTEGFDAANQITIEEVNAYNFSLVLLEKFNQAASDLGVTFILASKASQDESPLNYPGTIVYNMNESSGQIALKTYIGPLESGGFGEITEIQYYKDYGISAAAYDNAMQNELKGISKNAIDDILTNAIGIEHNNIFTVVLCNRLNTETANASTYPSPFFSFMAGVHPFTADFKSYYGILPYHMFLDADVDNIANDMFSSATSEFLDIYNKSDMQLENSHTMLKNFIGSMFGLLNPGISSYTNNSIYLVPNCASEEGDCFLTSFGLTGGDCCDDTPQVSYFTYWQDILQYDTWDSISECNGETILDRNNISSHVSNPMNFIDASIDEGIGFTFDQKLRVQRSFALSGSVLYNMKMNIENYITRDEYAPIFCSEELSREFNAKVKQRIRFSSKIEESKKFEKIKNKVINLCTNV